MLRVNDSKNWPFPKAACAFLGPGLHSPIKVKVLRQIRKKDSKKQILWRRDNALYDVKFLSYTTGSPSRGDIGTFSSRPEGIHPL